ncbi:MAG: hypothetical protein RIS19_660, partial [Actinomycetota bacterium]
SVAGIANDGPKPPSLKGVSTLTCPLKWGLKNASDVHNIWTNGNSFSLGICK